MNKKTAILIISGMLWLLPGCGDELPQPVESVEKTERNVNLDFLFGGEDKEEPDIYRISLVHQDGTKERMLADHMRYRSYGVELHLIEQDGDNVDKNIVISLGSDYLIEKLQRDMITVRSEE